MFLAFKSTPPAKRYFTTMFLFSCLMLAIFTLVIYQQSLLNQESNRWIVHSYEVLRYGRNFLIHMYDADIAERNYLATGSQAYLDTYTISIDKINNDLASLSKLVVDKEDQSARINGMRDEVVIFEKTLGEEIHLSRGGQSTVYSLSTAARAHEKVMDDIRNRVREFSQAEYSLLNTRTDMAHTREHNYMLTLFIGAILNVGALVIANLVIFGLIGRNDKTEQDLRASEELVSKILNGVNDGVYDYNVSAGSVAYSGSYEALLGYSLQELGRVHDNFYQYMHPEDVAVSQQVMREYLAREIPVYCNIFRIRHKDGHWVWLMSRGIGIWKENGNPVRLIGTHTDITAQKRREEELNFFMNENKRQAEELAVAMERAESASQAKSDFLATMSHEIRTPLNAIVGLSRLLIDKVKTVQQREMMETLYANADILLKLVNDLLDLSRVEAAQTELEKRPFTLTTLFRALHAMFDEQAAGKGLTISITDNSKGQVLIGDPTRLQQILINLISNALKFTNRGAIAVTADCAYVPGSPTADVKITVADTGVGIPPDRLAVVFDKFVQADKSISRRFGGFGLGLAISKSLAQLMGGDITVASAPGEGSIFTVRLPLPVGERPDVTIAASNTMPASRASGGTVLVTEDYAPNVMVATMMLEHLGFSADVARSGEEALEKIRERPTPYIAVLMDVQMQGIDGFETTRRIRLLEKERGHRHFIIGVTAHALTGDRERCLAVGMDDYMSKPINPDLLAQKLNRLERAA
jgi:PAS domain S-box-containing protein